MQMTNYRIKELGSSYVVVADGQDVLICADETVARAITTEAQRPAVAFHQRPENFIGPRRAPVHQDYTFDGCATKDTRASILIRTGGSR
jgi:hypothetical protein